MLIHNGLRGAGDPDEVRRLLGPGGHLLCVEADVSGLAIPPEATVEADLERCWVDWGSP